MGVVNRKLTNTVLYLLRHCPERLGITQVLKLLFYADYHHYRQHLSSITGQDYVALERGPVLDGYRARFDAMTQSGAIRCDEVQVEGKAKPKLEFQPLMEPDLDVFSESEIRILKQVVHECGSMSGLELSNRTHREPPWIFAWNPEKKSNPIPPMAFRWMDNLPSEAELEIALQSLADAGIKPVHAVA